MPAKVRKFLLFHKGNPNREVVGKAAEVRVAEESSFGSLRCGGGFGKVIFCVNAGGDLGGAGEGRAEKHPVVEVPTVAKTITTHPFASSGVERAVHKVERALGGTEGFSYKLVAGGSVHIAHNDNVGGRVVGEQGFEGGAEGFQVSGPVMRRIEVRSKVADNEVEGGVGRVWGRVGECAGDVEKLAAGTGIFEFLGGGEKFVAFVEESEVDTARVAGREMDVIIIGMQGEDKVADHGFVLDLGEPDQVGGELVEGTGEVRNFGVVTGCVPTRRSELGVVVKGAGKGVEKVLGVPKDDALSRRRNGKTTKNQQR